MKPHPVSLLAFAVLFALMLGFVVYHLALSRDATGSLARVSVSSIGQQANSGSAGPAVSANGRFVAFDSGANNLVPNDTNGSDVFVHDFLTRETTRVSVSSTGVEGMGNSSTPALSADGRYVAFISAAPNLVADDTNGREDIFVHDRQTGQTTRVSLSAAGGQINSAYFPDISGDGRFVTFTSRDPSVVPGDTNKNADVFVHDRQTGQTSRVSVDSAGIEGKGESGRGSFSADGRYVVFDSNAPNLDLADVNFTYDIFVHDRQTGSTSLVSVGPGGMAGNGMSIEPDITADGRYVAFGSEATDLVAGDENDMTDIFVHDRQTGQTVLVSVTSAGEQGDKSSLRPAISDDGRVVAFESYAANLDGDDSNEVLDVFRHDRQTGQTRRISIGLAGAPADGFSNSAALSGSGITLAFTSFAANLVPDDTNEVADIFAHKETPLTLTDFAYLPIVVKP